MQECVCANTYLLSVLKFGFSMSNHEIPEEYKQPRRSDTVHLWFLTEKVSGAHSVHSSYSFRKYIDVWRPERQRERRLSITQYQPPAVYFAQGYFIDKESPQDFASLQVCVARPGSVYDMSFSSDLGEGIDATSYYNQMGQLQSFFTEFRATESRFGNILSLPEKAPFVELHIEETLEIVVYEDWHAEEIVIAGSFPLGQAETHMEFCVDGYPDAIYRIRILSGEDTIIVELMRPDGISKEASFPRSIWRNLDFEGLKNGNPAAFLDLPTHLFTLLCVDGGSDMNSEQYCDV